MNKKKLILTIIMDLLVIAILTVAIYLLMFKNLNEWQSNIATFIVVIAFPTIFYSLFTQFAISKYGKLKDKDDKLWEEMSEINETSKLNEKDKDTSKEIKSAT